jgi:hypothetical protein
MTDDATTTTPAEITEQTFEVKLTPLPSNRILGFRQNWLSAELGNGITVELSSGAGLGSSLMAFEWSDKDGYHALTVDVRDLFQDVVDRYEIQDRTAKN